MFQIFGQIKIGIIGVIFRSEFIDYINIRLGSILTAGNRTEYPKTFNAEPFPYVGDICIEFRKNLITDTGLIRHRIIM